MPDPDRTLTPVGALPWHPCHWCGIRIPRAWGELCHRCQAELWGIAQQDPGPLAWYYSVGIHCPQAGAELEARRDCDATCQGDAQAAPLDLFRLDSPWGAGETVEASRG